MKPYEGLITAMVTPFAADGSINQESAVALGRHLVGTGSDGIAVAATTGEGSTLGDDERIDLLRLIVEEFGDQAAIIAGTGSNNTAHAVELTERAVDAGADAILSVAPYYNKPPAAGLIRHYEEISSAAGGTPLVLYNNPARTIINMDPELLARLAQIPGVEAVKQANDSELTTIDGLTVLAGNDDVVGHWFGQGGKGAICVASHIVGPQMKQMLVDPSSCETIAADLQEVFETLAFATAPIGIKAALNILGHNVGGLRLPLVQANAEEHAIIEEMLTRKNITSLAAVS